MHVNIYVRMWEMGLTELTKFFSINGGSTVAAARVLTATAGVGVIVSLAEMAGAGEVCTAPAIAFLLMVMLYQRVNFRD